MLGDDKTHQTSARRALSFGRTAMALAAVGVCLALTGCQGEQPPTAGAPTLATPSTSSSAPSPTQLPEPTPPPAVRVKNQAGAEAAFRYFLDTYTYGYATGNAIPLRGAVTDRCEFCLGIVESIGKLASSGEHYEHGGQEVTSLVSVRANDDAAYLLRVVVDQSRAVLVAEDGATKRTESATRAQALDSLVVWDGDRWRVDKLGVVGGKAS
ncbi:MAG: DUF6318 family protein [Kineosporiaceae bacterium]